MSKTNIIDEATDKLAEITQQAGVLAMTTAALLSVIQLPDQPKKLAILPKAMTLAPALAEEDTNQLRREQEETAPHYISYSVAQRTPARSGRQ